MTEDGNKMAQAYDTTSVGSGTHGIGAKTARASQLQRRLKSVAFFWQNDLPDGIGMYIQTPDMGDALADTFRQLEQFWNELSDKAALTADLFEQLRQFRAMPESHRHDPENWSVVLGNIHLLTKYGYMPNDEYNGIIYLYEAAPAAQA